MLYSPTIDFEFIRLNGTCSLWTDLKGGRKEPIDIGLSLRDQFPYLQILLITIRPGPASRLVNLTFHPQGTGSTPPG